MKNICNSHECFEAIREKFKIDEITNLLYNERLKNEIIKRQNYSESRRNNRLKSKHMNNISKTYVKHMENENETEIENRIVNENKTKIKKALIPNFDEFLDNAVISERAIIFHHGTPGHASAWASWLDDAAQLGLRAISYSRAGYGTSDRHPGRSVVSINSVS